MSQMSTRQLLSLQVRVLGALVLRETRSTFGTSKFGYLWAIITPAFSVAFLVLIFSQIGRQPPFGQSLALFFATGVLPLQFFKKSATTLMGALSGNKALLTYPPIKELDTIVARWILLSVTYLIIMLIFFGALISVGLAPFPKSPHILLQAFILTAFLGFGFGTVNAVIAAKFQSWKQLVNIALSPMLFLTGIFYVPSSLPPHAINIIKWNPVLHIVEYMRTGYYPNYDSQVLNIYYPIGVTMLLILLGLFGERIYRKARN